MIVNFASKFKRKKLVKVLTFLKIMFELEQEISLDLARDKDCNDNH